MLLIDRARALLALRSIADSEMTDERGDIEHALHEVCHAVVLGIAAPGPDDLSFVVGRKIQAMQTRSHARADWQEIMVVAAELRATELLGGLPGGGRHLTISDVLGGNTNSIPREEAEAHVQRLLGCETTYRRARAALCWAIASAPEQVR